MKTFLIQAMLNYQEKEKAKQQPGLYTQAEVNNFVAEGDRLM